MFRCLFPLLSPLFVRFPTCFPRGIFLSSSLSLFKTFTLPPRRKMSHLTWLRAKVNASRFPPVCLFSSSSSNVPLSVILLPPRRCRSKFIFYSFRRCNTVSRWRLPRMYMCVYIGLLARDLKGNPTSFEKRQYWIRPALLCCSLFVSLARDRYVPRLAYLIIRHIDGSMSIRVSRIQLANVLVLFFRVLFLRRGYFLRILRNWIKVIPRSGCGSILKRRW